MTKYIINCTAHKLSDEQLSDKNIGATKRPINKIVFLNLVDIDPVLHSLLCNTGTKVDKEVSDLMNFMRNWKRILRDKSEKITNNSEGFFIFPIGSPYFQKKFWKKASGRNVLFSHSVRESVDLPDGRKVSKFRHIQWLR